MVKHFYKYKLYLSKYLVYLVKQLVEVQGKIDVSKLETSGNQNGRSPT
jgi:hypothetical protein